MTLCICWDVSGQPYPWAQFDMPVWFCDANRKMMMIATATYQDVSSFRSETGKWMHIFALLCLSMLRVCMCVGARCLRRQQASWCLLDCDRGCSWYRRPQPRDAGATSSLIRASLSADKWWRRPNSIEEKWGIVLINWYNPQCLECQVGNGYYCCSDQPSSS